MSDYPPDSPESECIRPLWKWSCAPATREPPRYLRNVQSHLWPTSPGRNERKLHEDQPTLNRVFGHDPLKNSLLRQPLSPGLDRLEQNFVPILAVTGHIQILVNPGKRMRMDGDISDLRSLSMHREEFNTTLFRNVFHLEPCHFRTPKAVE